MSRPAPDTDEHPRPHIDVPISVFGEPLFREDYDLLGRFVHVWCHAVWKKDPHLVPIMTESQIEQAVAFGFLKKTRKGHRLTGPHKDPKWLMSVRRSWITYAIEAVGYGCVKIGHTTDIDKRLENLQCASPAQLRVIGTLEGDHEICLHRNLRAFWLSGEWFTLNADSMAIMTSAGLIGGSRG